MTSPIDAADRAASAYLKKLRDASGMPVAELARRAGLRRERVHSYLSGQTAPTWGMIKQLAAVLGVENVQDVADGIDAIAASQDASE